MLLTNFIPDRFGRIHALWLGIFLLCTGLQLADFVTAWRYDRVLVTDSHWWLLFSGHLVHFDWLHWLLNMTGLAIVAFFFSNYGTLWQWLLVLLVSALVVGLGIHWYRPDVITYVGLSGVLHGLFMFGALREISRYPLSGYLLLALLVAKLAYEAFVGVMPYSEQMTAARVITDAHLYGGIAGAGCYFMLRISRQFL